MAGAEGVAAFVAELEALVPTKGSKTVGRPDAEALGLVKDGTRKGLVKACAVVSRILNEAGAVLSRYQVEATDCLLQVRRP